MKSNPNVKSQRLFGAIDLLLEAIGSPNGMNSLIPIYRDDPPADAAAPAARYTLKEFVEAMTILVRVGIVPTEPRVGAANDNGSHDAPPLNHPPAMALTTSNDPGRRKPLAVLPRDRPHVIRIGCVANATLN